MDLVSLGLSLRSASLPALEALSEGARLARAEERVRALPGVRESVRLVTCQRALLLLGVSHPLRNASSDSVAGSAATVSHRRGDSAATLSLVREARRILAEEAGIAGGSEPDGIITLSGPDAFRHLVRLACGLESPIEGETEILGQLRAAYAAAVERGAAGRITGGAMHRVFRAARRIRANAGLPAVSPSWGEFLADTIVSSCGLGHGERIRVIGSGALGQALTVSLRARGLRVSSGASDAPALTGGDRDRANARVLVTVSGRGRILGASDPVLAHRGGPDGTLEIWDLGMPRNVDPEVARLPEVRLRTLADIPAFARATEARREARRVAEELIEEETGHWTSWRQERSSARTLVRLGRMLEVSAAPTEDGPAPEARADATQDGFRRALLKAFAAMAQEARDEDEASSHLALFEEALRRATSLQPARRARAAASTGAVDAAPIGRRSIGTVSLVGAGPGAGGLLTLEGARRLAEADVVYHDALSREEVLTHCHPGARLVPVGKRRGRASASQEEIEAALVRDAKAGLRVVRLKGGDPFVFGRGGEEGLALQRAGVPFEVVPGVSSGIAAPALAGIPLTHRGLASSAAFVTAHDLSEAADGEERRARLAHLARGAETLVVFMAGAELARVRHTLLDAGLDSATPAALIESGATPDQRVAIGTLDGLETLAEGLRGGPALVVIGRTVGLADVLGSGDRWTAKAALEPKTEAPAAPEATVTEMRQGRSPKDKRRAG